MNAPAASAALAGAVPRGATILLGEWQHGCGSSILSKMAEVESLVARVLLERPTNLGQSVPVSGLRGGT